MLTIVLYLPGKVFIPKKVVDPIMENVTLEPELEEALANASDAEICDIAGRKTRTFTCAHPFTDRHLFCYHRSCFISSRFTFFSE